MGSLITLMAAAAAASSLAARDTYDQHTQDNLRDCGRRHAAAAFCRLPQQLTAQEVEARLGGKDAAWRVEGDRLTVVARRNGPNANLCCSIRAPMKRLGSGPLWAVSIRIPEIRRATIDIGVFPGGAMSAYQGPDATPQPVAVGALKGRLVQTSIDSRFLGAVRRVTVYLPPGFEPSRTYPVLYAADGVFREDDARLIERLVLSGAVRPLVMVSPWPGIDMSNLELRRQEYLPAYFAGAKAFRRHEDFFLKELIPLAERQYGASARREDRMLTGYSNGAAWAVAMGLRHPKLFGQVAAFSYGWEPAEVGADRRGRPRMYLSAGKLEPVFLRHTTRLAALARRAGDDVVFETPVAGHTDSQWRPALAAALKWAFPARAS